MKTIHHNVPWSIQPKHVLSVTSQNVCSSFRRRYDGKAFHTWEPAAEKLLSLKLTCCTALVIAQPTITLNKYYAYVCQTYKRLKKKPRRTSPNLQADILILEVLNLSAQDVNRCWCPATGISASLWLPATHMAINYLSIPFCYTYAFDMGLPDFSCSNGTHSTYV